MEEHNPFQSPTGFEQASIQGDRPPIPTSGMVGQVRVVAVLQIVQGVLELLMGIGLALMTAMAPTIFQANAAAQAPGVAEMRWVMLFWGFSATFQFVAGVLRIAAGIQNWRYRGRLLGIIASVVGLGSVMSCYCAPTSIALAVYALVILLNENVSRVFRQQAQHHT